MNLRPFSKKVFGKSTVFVNSIWSKIKKDSQYQQEEVQDWASHLEHLQSILLEFDTRCAPTEDVLCRYFYEGLRPSIRLWIDEEGRELDGWDSLVKRATRAEAKAKMQASVSRDIDQHCHRGNRTMHTTAGKAQVQTTKDFRAEEPKAWPQKARPQQQQQQQAETTKKSRKKKDRQFARDRQGSTPATGVNSIQSGEPNQKKKNDDKNQSRLGLDKTPRDLSRVKCFNCQKMDHYANTCLEPKN